MSADAMPRAIMACMSDEAFWESFHYRPMREVDGVLAERMTEVFIDSFAAAALLARPDRDAIEAQLELEVGFNAEGHRAIAAGFMFAGARPCGAEWDGTSADAERLVESMAVEIAESLTIDPHEDDDWRESFERRT
jgi:hypothetical protein